MVVPILHFTFSILHSDAPRTNGGNFHGQSDAWVLANFTNAEEILSVGYTNWVDGQVGTGLI